MSHSTTSPHPEHGVAAPCARHDAQQTRRNLLAHPHEQRVLGDDGLPRVDVAGGDEAHALTEDLALGDGGARHGDVSRASRSGGPTRS